MVAVGRSYVKDDNKVYYCESSNTRTCFMVKGADANTFELIMTEGEYPYANGFVTRDKNSLYSRGVAVTNSDPNTFTFMEQGNAQTEYNASDKNNKYGMSCHMDGCRLEIVEDGVAVE